MGVPPMLYTHWKTYPSRAVTSPTPVTVTLCSVLFWKEYIVNPGKAVARSSPPSAVSLCIQVGSVGTASCLQMRVSWSEQLPPWSSRETLKTAVRCTEHGTWIVRNRASTSCTHSYSTILTNALINTLNTISVCTCLCTCMCLPMVQDFSTNLLGNKHAANSQEISQTT